MFGKNKKQPINLNDLSNRHLFVAISAHCQLQEEQGKGTLARRHLQRIAMRHLSISNLLDGMLQAYQKKVERP